MSLISIEIGPTRISAVQGTVSGGNLEIAASASIPLKRGCVADSMVKNQADLTAAITRLLGSNPAFTAKKAAVTIHPGNALIREFILPAGSARQLDAMVRSEMTNYNASAATDVIEYQMLENLAASGGAKSVRVRAASLSIDIVNGYHQALLGAKLRPEALDLNLNAVEKLMARRPELNGTSYAESCFVLIDFGYQGIMAYVFYDYKVIASRFIPIGLADFEPVVNSARFTAGDGSDMPTDFARLLDFRKEGAADPKTMSLAEDILLQCANELQKLIIFSSSRMPRSAVSCAFLIGEGALIPGLDGFLAAELNAPVMPLTQISGVRFSGPAAEMELPYLLNAAGAMIRL